MSGIPGKIVLKSTTKISLTERFAGIRQNAAVYQQNAQQVKVLRPAAGVYNGTGFRGPLGSTSPRDRMRRDTQTSQRNMRLAQQMANRPAVLAAMKLKQRSLRYRLGTPNRVSPLPRSSLPVRARLGRLPRTNGRTGGFGVGRGRGWGRGYRGRGTRGLAFGIRGRGGYRGRSAGVAQGYRRGGGYFGGGRGRGGRGRGRGGRGGGRPRVSREILDAQLDQYMAKSRATLDMELDVYMAGTDD